MKTRFPGRVGLALPLAAALLAGCVGEDSHHRDWEAMSSNFAATLHEPSAGKIPGEAALDSIVSDSRRWDSLFSDYEGSSGIARLRGRQGDTVQLATDVVALLDQALRVGRLSGGYFDLGLHDLKALWILQDAEPRVPPADSVRSALARRWPRGTPEPGRFSAPLRILDEGRVQLETDSLPVDLGGIAKGYAVDRMSERLAALGWPVHLIQAGGEIRCSGRRDRPWAIGVKNPRRRDTVAAVVRLDSGAAVSTSGDYERFFLAAGRRYHHILDPFLGEPSRSVTASTTVLCSTSTVCDAFSTALFLLGPALGAPLAERQGLQALWLRETPGTPPGVCGIVTRGWGRRLERGGLPDCPAAW